MKTVVYDLLKNTHRSSCVAGKGESAYQLGLEKKLPSSVKIMLSLCVFIIKGLIILTIKNEIKMENNGKELMMKRIKYIESMYEQDNGYSELTYLTLHYKLYRTIGIDIVTALQVDRDFQGVVEFCRSYVERNKVSAEWIIKRHICGVEMNFNDKIELAKYHIALTHLAIFG